MRQVNEAEIVWSLKYELSRLPAATRTRLGSREHSVRKVAEQMLAEALANRLRRYEILSDTPSNDGDDLFTAAAYGTPGSLIIGDRSDK